MPRRETATRMIAHYPAPLVDSCEPAGGLQRYLPRSDRSAVDNTAHVKENTPLHPDETSEVLKFDRFSYRRKPLHEANPEVLDRVSVSNGPPPPNLMIGGCMPCALIFLTRGRLGPRSKNATVFVAENMKPYE